ncbi:replication protein C, IncQ-type, partial [Aeromonas caviae]|uniref:replication protein C, IncQ-type n=1 Tax=Aeromonas caviae TaxID=648 RepID=UPI0022A7A019
APGLFRSLKRGERKRLKLDVTYTHGDDSIRFWGPEPLALASLEAAEQAGGQTMRRIVPDVGKFKVHRGSPS